MERTKYPRTYHLSFSQGVQSDDKVIQSLDKLRGQEVVVLLKMDGENTTLYRDNYLHARSLDSVTNWTRDMAKKIHSGIASEIPENYRLCCENLYAKHAIHYPDGYLEGYLYLLSIWDEKNQCLSWDETLIYAELLDLPTPKQFYRGVFDEAVLKKIVSQLDTSIEEGFVVRRASGFAYEDFSACVTKYVREGHVQSETHWLKTAVPNGALSNPSKPAFLTEARRKLKI